MQSISNIQSADNVNGSGVVKKKRARIPISCTECRARKQKCNKTKDRPCSNCARRYPPVICSYDYPKKSKQSTDEPNLEDHVPQENFDVDGDGFINWELADVDAGGAVNEQDLAQYDPKLWELPSVSIESAPPQEASNDIPYETAMALLSQHPDQMYANGIQSMIRQTNDTPKPVAPENILRSQPHADGNVGGMQLVQGKKKGKRPRDTSQDMGDLEDHFVRLTLNPYPLRQRVPLTYGCPEAFDPRISSPTTLKVFHPLPINNTNRNAELFHFFHHVLSTFIGAIDGVGQSAIIKQGYLPWIVKSPLIAYTAMLSSSCFQAEAKGLDVSKHAEAIEIKGNIISMINQRLSDSSMAISDEVVATVMHLSTNEWYHGEAKSQIAHMKGLGQMVRLRGGLESFAGKKSLYVLLIITDYQVACTCERDVIYTPPTIPLPNPTSYSPVFASPFLGSPTSFKDLASELNISTETATILDDMRFLTKSIISLNEKHSTSTPQQFELETTKVLTTAKWILERVKALPSIRAPTSPLAGDFVYETCRLAATVYTTSIVSHLPLSQSCTIFELQQFWGASTRIPLSQWKSLSGIYLWICAVFAPAAQWTVFGRFLKSMVCTSMTFIGLEEWEVMVSCVEGLLGVMRWLRGENNESNGSSKKVKRARAMKSLE